MSGVKETTEFFASPALATTSLRSKIVKLGMPSRHLQDFLDRLDIRAGQPPQASIDAVILHEIGAIWPSLSTPEREALFDRLLVAAEAAQAGQAQPEMIRRHLAARLRPLRSGHATTPPSAEVPGTPIDAQVLSREMLRELTPPIANESVDSLLARIAAGDTASALELKLRAAGAGRDTIKIAIEMRATAEIERQQVVAARADGASPALARLEGRLLAFAEAIARKAELQASANPAVGARPGEFIFAELQTHPHDLGSLDEDGVLERRASLVLGLLCHLSDLCKFSWRAL